MTNDVRVVISEETKHQMLQFFLKTSIPRIVLEKKKEKADQEVRTKQE